MSDAERKAEALHILLAALQVALTPAEEWRPVGVEEPLGDTR